MEYSQDVIEKIIKLSKADLSSRTIAKLILGSETKKSTVNNILNRNRIELDEIGLSNQDNSRILFISDMHIPFHHQDTFKLVKE